MKGYFMMNCNEFMKKHFALTKQIDNKLERLQRLSALAKKTTTTINDCPTSSSRSGKSREDLMVAMLDLADEISKDYLDLCKTEAEMSAVIKSVEDDWAKAVLEKRCLLHKKWDIIAYEMECSIETIFKKREFVLSELEKVLKLQ